MAYCNPYLTGLYFIPYIQKITRVPFGHGSSYHNATMPKQQHRRVAGMICPAPRWIASVSNVTSMMLNRMPPRGRIKFLNSTRFMMADGYASLVHSLVAFTLSENIPVISPSTQASNANLLIRPMHKGNDSIHDLVCSVKHHIIGTTTVVKLCFYIARNLVSQGSISSPTFRQNWSWPRMFSSQRGPSWWLTADEHPTAAQTGDGCGGSKWGECTTTPATSSPVITVNC